MIKVYDCYKNFSSQTITQPHTDDMFITSYYSDTVMTCLSQAITVTQ